MKNEKFEEYFLKYKNLVIRIVMNKLNDYQLAQEICQQVFISLYTNMNTVPEDLVKAWIIRCTQNAIIDFARRSHTKEKVISSTPISEVGNIAVSAEQELIEDKIVNMELTGRILREVKEVNEQWYEVLMVHCVDGLPYPEAAKKLNIPVAVLRARIYRARLYIREKFGDEYQQK